MSQPTQVHDQPDRDAGPPVVGLARQTVLRSHARCATKDAFFHAFISLLTDSHPKMAVLFGQEDVGRQLHTLRSALDGFLGLPMADHAARAYLQQLSHEPLAQTSPTSPDVFALWVDALMASLWQHDPSFSNDLEIAWRAELKKGREDFAAGVNTTSVA